MLRDAENLIGSSVRIHSEVFVEDMVGQNYFKEFHVNMKYTAYSGRTLLEATAAAKHINFSIFNVDELKVEYNYRNPPFPYLYISQGDVRDYKFALFLKKVKILTLFNEAEHFMYCRTERLEMRRNILAALLSPFDRSTWIILVLFMLTIS